MPIPLITVRELTIGYRGPLLLDHVSCQIDAGQRIGLLGRNGAGKTTFMRLLSGQVEADGGEIIFAPGTRAALLPQEVPQDLTGTNFEIVTREALAAAGEHAEGVYDAAWKIEQRANQLLDNMSLAREAKFESLSSGMKRRVLLARALVTSPDLLLLDEPTNHLDVDAIIWLEEFLLRTPATLIFVTHDRMFLRKLSTRIIEIERGRLFDWSCDYDTFLRRKEEALDAEEKQNALFDKRLAEEEVWIRTGIRARRTRNEGRVRALEEMRRVREGRRERTGGVKLEIQAGQKSGTLVAEVDGASFAYGDRPIFRDFSTAIMRGDKIGIIGPNGAGKTTLLRVLLGQLPPQSGKVRLGTNLQIAYFDQLRQQLNDDDTVQQCVGDGYTTVQTASGEKHIIGYLQDFLFTPERARTPVRLLSGGERNRVLLAKLFAKPANVIVLDEPTNDLDAETLEMLEQRLVEYTGTVIVVSHDRAFLNNVVTSTIVFEPGNIKEYVGGYDDWLRQRPAPLEAAAKSADKSKADKLAGEKSASDESKKRRPSFKERQEREALPATIERIETEIQQLHAEMGDPKFYQQPGDAIAKAGTRLKELEDQLASAYERWEVLDALAE